MSAELKCVNPQWAKDVWPLVKDRLSAAFDKTDIGSFAFCEGDVLSGQALLWLLLDGGKIEACGVTKIVYSQRSKVLMCEACSGKSFVRNRHVMRTIEQYAKDVGCNKVRICGRHGWERVFPDYRKTAVILERQL